MRFLPIVERELIVASRHSRTWWRRVLTLGVALGLFGFVFLAFGTWGGVSRVGRELFTFFSGFSMLYALAAGPLATTDCIARERREQTLGLLFLTRLRSYDVVLGKLTAASIDLVFGLMACLPLLAVPMLLGGISGTQLVLVVIGIAGILFMSLAVGICCSSFFPSGRAALGLTLLVLLFLFIGLPFIGEEVFGIHNTSWAAPYAYMFSPMYTMELALQTRAQWMFWLNISALASLAVLCLVLASLSTWKAWRDVPPLSVLVRCRDRFHRWRQLFREHRFGQWRQRVNDHRATWRRRLGENPVLWLEGRDVLQQYGLWTITLLCVSFWTVKHLQSPQSWPNNDWLYLWPMLSHYTLCLWIAIQSPRRFSDDKQSGALELLLCTPLSTGEIIGGVMAALRQRFGSILLLLMALDSFLVYAYFNVHGGLPALVRNDIFPVCIYCLMLFPLQALSLGKLGAYLGLAWGNSLRATISVVWRIGLLPWVLFIALMMTLEYTRRFWRFPRSISSEGAMLAWALSHLLICGYFLAYASTQLRRHFRDLAAQARPIPWWKRISPNRISRSL